MTTKSLLLIAVATLGLSVGTMAQNLVSNGFYSINFVTDHLVFIDTLGNQTDIGYIGRDINSNTLGKTVGLAYHNNGLLYLSYTDTLYSVNRNSGLATPIFRTYNSSTNMGVSGSIAFDKSGQLYLFKEESTFTQGKLFTVNLINGAATPVSNNTSGNASILGISFINSTLFGASELDDKLLKINSSTGVVSKLYANSLGMSFTNALTSVNNELWGIDIINETTSNTIKFCKIDTLTGVSVLKFSKSAIYVGLAYGPSPICYNYITVTDTLMINMGITEFNPVTYNNTIKIFPNPTKDYITINYGDYASLNGYQLKIINSLSQNVFQTNITQQSDYMNLTNWGGKGLYFVQIIDSQGNIVDIRKIVLQ